MSGWGGHIRVAVGAVAGGILGFYVMHHAEIKYKEQMREEYLKVLSEKQALEDATSFDSGAKNANVVRQQRN
ncbi:unnamed protein product [Calypogeia fissa]